MRLYLVNPSNPLVSIVNIRESRWNRYRVWKPLSLMVLAGLTPPGWKIRILDENLGPADYLALPRPDLVGITAFTWQANRAYEVAAYRSNIRVDGEAYANFRRQHHDSFPSLPNAAATPA